MNIQILKRDGRKVNFDSTKITNAMRAAISEVEAEYSEGEIVKLTKLVIDKIESTNLAEISVEKIQDLVEHTLVENDHIKAYEAYRLYRITRTEIRESNTTLMKEFKDITFKDAEEVDSKRENANIDGNTAMGTMLQYGTTSSKKFAMDYILNEESKKAHAAGDIHIHDLDFGPIGTLTCCQIDIKELFKGGFSTGHGFVREPNDVVSYAALAAIAIQANQNDQHGGQSIPNLDYGIAPGVLKTYQRLYKDELETVLEARYDLSMEKIKELIKLLPALTTIEPSNEEIEMILKFLVEFLNDENFKVETTDIKEAEAIVRRKAYAKTVKRTYQAMEALLHNLNTMHSRAGAQVPFSSVNFGTDVSPEGRLVIEQFLLSTEAGLGNGETAIFPISIFKVKEGVSYNPEDPNYDLFKLAMRVSSKRLFPNFSFLDSPFNKEYYKPGRPETEACYMGCRTRVVGSVFEESNGIIYGRGNNSFTSINLPRLGIKHGIVNGRTEADWKGFYEELDQKLELVTEQLLLRYNLQKKKKVKNFPFLMGEGVWFNSKELQPNDTIEKVIQHGTLTAGFIGLAECLVAMTGKHHGHDEETQKLGLEIITHMRNRMDEMAEKYTLNFSLIATPAEGLSSRFTRIDRKKYGVIEGVNDREYYTNSFHVPVYYNINAFDKVSKEAPYHNLCNAGHISYIELDGDASKNLEAFELIIRHMKESGIGYGSINHPVDRDPVCGFKGIIHDACPKCGRTEHDSQIKFDRIRRITGYLVGTLDKWNDGKTAEEADRVKHCTRPTNK